MAGLAWVWLGTSGLVRGVVQVQDAAVTACHAGSVSTDCWCTASVPNSRRPTPSLAQNHDDPRRMVQNSPQERNSASRETCFCKDAQVGETVVCIHPVPLAAPLAGCVPIPRCIAKLVIRPRGLGFLVFFWGCYIATQLALQLQERIQVVRSSTLSLSRYTCIHFSIVCLVLAPHSKRPMAHTGGVQK